MDLVCEEVSWQRDNLLFERLILEISRVGLSWITVLKIADNFRDAYSRYDKSASIKFRVTYDSVSKKKTAQTNEFYRS
jgi:3-methyladenine DNA glycosylase Tag